MDIWLASYPRSGNTFLRIVLNSVFGLRSTSVYDGETKVYDEFADVSKLVGHYEQNSLDSEAVSQRQTLRLVKTHGVPMDASPSIYIVRDGRMACVSYFHFLRSFVNENITVEDIIVGKQWPGSWSQHVQSWCPTKRQSTLLIRYEDLRDENEKTCLRISQFLGTSPLKDFNVAFSELQRMNPKFFREGNDKKSREEFQPFNDVFMEHHGAAMSELGYV
jgi:hypothetical protein